jgi:hypothetical protein
MEFKDYEGKIWTTHTGHYMGQREAVKSLFQKQKRAWPKWFVTERDSLKDKEPVSIAFAFQFMANFPKGNEVPSQYLGRDMEDYWSWGFALGFNREAEGWTSDHHVFDVYYTARGEA